MTIAGRVAEALFTRMAAVASSDKKGDELTMIAQ
jgi:hypothetical protein